MGRTQRATLGLALVAGLLIAACGGGGTTTASGAPRASGGPRLGSFDRPIVLAFTPSVEAATISTNGAAIKAALERATGLAWKVTAMTSYAAEVEGMCSGAIDIGFFAPLQMTLLLNKQCGTPVLAALRRPDQTKPESATNQLSPTYESQIVVRVDSGINDLNGLKGKKFVYTLYQWDGLQTVDAKFFDPMNEAAKLAGVDVEKLAQNTPRPAATPTPTKSP